MKKKAKLSLLLICVLLFIGYFSFTLYEKTKVLSHDELLEFIDQHYFQDKQVNLTIELEKDVDDLHLLLLSYQQDPNAAKYSGLAAFKRLPNGKYKYNVFLQSAHAVLPTGKGYYGVFSGIITNNQPTKYLITIDGNEFTDTFERNKYFIREYYLDTQSGFSMQPVN